MKLIQFPDLCMLPETALVRKGEPIFLPDDENWYLNLLIGAKIERLGKSIEARFSNRYWSNAVVGLKLFNLDKCEKKTWPNGFDASIATNDMSYCEKPFIVFSETLLKRGSVCQRIEEFTFNPYDIRKQLDEAVSYASKFFTLHTGDIIFYMENLSIKVVTDTRVIIEQDSEILMNHKIK